MICKCESNEFFNPSTSLCEEKNEVSSEQMERSALENHKEQMLNHSLIMQEKLVGLLGSFLNFVNGSSPTVMNLVKNDEPAPDFVPNEALNDNEHDKILGEDVFVGGKHLETETTVSYPYSTVSGQPLGDAYYDENVPQSSRSKQKPKKHFIIT